MNTEVMKDTPSEHATRWKDTGKILEKENPNVLTHFAPVAAFNGVGGKKNASTGIFSKIVFGEKEEDNSIENPPADLTFAPPSSVDEEIEKSQQMLRQQLEELKQQHRLTKEKRMIAARSSSNANKTKPKTESKNEQPPKSNKKPPPLLKDMKGEGSNSKSLLSRISTTFMRSPSTSSSDLNRLSPASARSSITESFKNLNLLRRGSLDQNIVSDEEDDDVTDEEPSGQKKSRRRFHFKREPTGSKEYWMPDKECKFCYDCQAPFSTIRRRHHCRICGQIFCNKCTQNYLKLPDGTPMRVCNICYKNHSKGDNPPRIMRALQARSPSEENIHKPTSPKSRDEKFLSKNYRPVPVQLSTDMLPHMSLSESSENQISSPPTMDSTIDTSAPSQLSSADELYLSYDKHLQKFDGEELPTPLRVHPRKLRKAITFDDFPLLIDEHKNQEKQTQPTQSEPPSKILSREADQHLRSIVEQLVKEEGLDQQWLDIILSFALRACTSIKPQVKNGDQIDIREYTKVKIIPFGSIKECKYIDGVVFSKNIGHKNLSFDIEKPKILLLGGGIEFERERKFLQMDDLLSQERSHLKFLIARIAALRPDLLLVSKTVSRVAQEFLLEENITFALNIKPSVLKRVARATNADILTSATDHLISPTLGTAEHFYVKTFCGDWGQKPIMYIDGCPKIYGCSIILRGAPKELLKKVKKTTLFAIYTAYNLFLEKQLLQDQFCTFKEQESDSTSDSSQKKLSTSMRVKFPSFKDTPDLPSMYDDESDKTRNPFAIVATPQFFLNRKALFDDAQGDELLVPNSRPLDVTMKQTPEDHQRLLYLHSLCCNTTSQQCTPYEVHAIDYYTENDLTLGQFLEFYCFDRTYKCKARNCNRNMIEHDRAFIHYNGRLNISVSDTKLPNPDKFIATILMWSSCKICGKATPYTPITEASWNYSWGKYLELCFYSYDPICIVANCGHSHYKDHIRYFLFGNLVAEFDYEPIDILEIVTPQINYGIFTPERIRDIDIELLSNTATHLYDYALKRMAQLEYDITKGIGKDPQLQTLMNQCKNEKAVFVEELEALRQSNSTQLNALRRKLLSNSVTWNSTLQEQISLRAPPKKKGQGHHVRHPSWKATSMEDGVASDDNAENNSSYDDTASYKAIPSLAASTQSLGASPRDSVTIPKEGIAGTPKTPAIPALIGAFTSLLSTGSNISQPLLFLPGYNDQVIVVYEDEPSSVIAYSLCSVDYRDRFDKAAQIPLTEDSWHKSVLKAKMRTDIPIKLEYEKYNYKTSISCTSYFSVKFHALRASCFREEQFILSLSRCKSWEARGGKSGSSFSKTADNRFIIKEISKIELEAFLESAQLYFEYLSNAIFQQVPSLLAKIFGVYTISIKNSNKQSTTNFVVMENLFYNRNINRIYDLKGSTRKREAPETAEVHWDVNLLEVMFTNPLWVDQLSKTKLQAAIWNDTLFLSSIAVMDYSLLVGIDNSSKQVVVGIIDYIRKYTWDKQFETLLKSMGRGADPTIISPNQYKVRFRDAMNKYFILVPVKNTHYCLRSGAAPIQALNQD